MVTNASRTGGGVRAGVMVQVGKILVIVLVRENIADELVRVTIVQMLGTQAAMSGDIVRGSCGFKLTETLRIGRYNKARQLRK
jgi:hypothetical protein